MNRILVLGNAGLDISLALPRLPLPGETLVASRASRAPGGKGLNQAVVAARAGARVVLGAPIGDDADGAVVVEALADEPFEGLRLIRSDEATDLSVVMVAPDGANSIVTIGGCAAALSADEAAEFAAGAEAGDLLLLQGNLSAAASLAAARAAVARGARLMVNAAPLSWSPGQLVELAAVLVVNEVEAAVLTASKEGEAAAALHAQGAALAIVTLGAAGCVAADARGTRHHPAVHAKPVDTSGAGDAFCGMLAAGLVRGLPTDAAIEAAQAAAALAVSRRGTFAALPRVEELATLARGGG
jgi:ribokinase